MLVLDNLRKILKRKKSKWKHTHTHKGNHEKNINTLKEMTYVFETIFSNEDTKLWRRQTNFNRLSNVQRPCTEPK